MQEQLGVINLPKDIWHAGWSFKLYIKDGNSHIVFCTLYGSCLVPDMPSENIHRQTTFQSSYTLPHLMGGGSIPLAPSTERERENLVILLTVTYSFTSWILPETCDQYIIKWHFHQLHQEFSNIQIKSFYFTQQNWTDSLLRQSVSTVSSKQPYYWSNDVIKCFSRFYYNFLKSTELKKVPLMIFFWFWALTLVYRKVFLLSGTRDRR